MDPLPLLGTPLSHMATTRNQEFLHLQDESKQNKVDIQRLTSELASTNTRLETFEAKVTRDLADVMGELASLTQRLKQSHGSISLEKHSHSEGEKSSHNKAFHSNSLPRDPCLPRVEVKKLWKNFKFVKNYGKIVAALTTLLKKNAFTWNPTTNHSFQELKEAMCTNLALAIPDFKKIFVLKCDAFDKGIGAVLMQEGRPLSFTSKQPLERHLIQSIYENEM
jgi:hypothetical protein